MDKKAKKMKNLGCANGWQGNTPPELEACNKLKADGTHPKQDAAPDRSHMGWSCTHTVECESCGYTYWYDSSG